MKKAISKSDLIRYTQPPDLVLATLFATLFGMLPLPLVLLVLKSWLDSYNIYAQPPDVTVVVSFATLFGVSPLGFIALPFAIAANTCYSKNKNEKAWRYSTISKWLIIAGALLTICFFLFVIGYLSIYGIDDPDC